MQAFCHRCHGDLPVSGDPVPFCPHCGSPQLFLADEYLASSVPTDSSGAEPPPLARETDWQAALTAAALVAGICGVLALIGVGVPKASFLATVWTLTASVTTVALYRRRRPAAWMDAATGARIGLATGVLCVVSLALALGIAGVFSRFALHSMARFDLDLASMLQQVKAGAAGSPSQPPAEVLAFYDIPEFQAGLVLTTLSLLAGFILLFSTCGGALGGLLRGSQRTQNLAS